MTPNERFARCEAQTLKYEGLWSDNPKDPGGPTYCGVTLPVLSAYLGRQASVAELRGASAQLIAAVYRGSYWAAVQGDQMPAGLDMMLFDGAVNSGRRRAVSWLQTALKVTADGSLGPVTLAALHNAAPANVLALIDGISAQRETFLRNLGTFPTFGNGWIARVSSVTLLSRQWAVQPA